MSRLARFLYRWQEPLIWLPCLVAVLTVAYYLIPAIDPRAGVDGWGAVWNMLPVVLAAVAAGFLAWLFKTLYFLELCDKDERELIDHACGIDRSITGERIGAGPATWHAVAVLLMDRLTWFAIFVLLLSRFSP